MHIAVYGSLKKGFHNNHMMDPRGFRYVGTFVTADRYHMASAGRFPIVFKAPATHLIEVEMYRVLDVAYLSQLDRLEGHPQWYKRQPVRIIGMPEAWMYLQEELPKGGHLKYQNVRYKGDVAAWVRTHD